MTCMCWTGTLIWFKQSINQSIKTPVIEWELVGATLHWTPFRTTSSINSCMASCIRKQELYDPYTTTVWRHIYHYNSCMASCIPIQQLYDAMYTHTTAVWRHTNVVYAPLGESRVVSDGCWCSWSGSVPSWRGTCHSSLVCSLHTPTYNTPRS